jgi:hypothetical protein
VPGALTAHAIKALCAVLNESPHWRDSGLALLEAFDAIDLKKIEDKSAVDAASRRIGKVPALSELILKALTRMQHKVVKRSQETSIELAGLSG